MVEERRRWPRWVPPPCPIRIGRGGGPPFLFSLSLFLLLLLQLGKGGNLLLVGVGLPPWARHRRPALPLLHSFIYGGGGHPKDTQVYLLAVCGAPLHSYTPRSYRCSA